MTPQAALRAIVARIQGEFDQPDLVAFGPLSPDRMADVLAIAEAAPPAPATPAHILGEDVARILRDVPEFAASVAYAAHREGCEDAWRQALAPLFPELDA